MSALGPELICQEIREQPAIVRARAASPPPSMPTGGRTVLTGAGDSLCAAELCAALYPGRGLEPLPALHATATARELGPADALLGISVSGRTPRVLEAALRAGSRGARVIAVTDDPASPLAEAAGETWLIGASPAEALGATSYADADAAGYVGYHHDVAQTKTFLAAVLTIARALEGARPEGTDWGRLADTVEDLVAPHLVERLEPVARHLAGAGQTFFLGSRTSLPLARFGAYKMFEFNRVAHHADVEEYCHTHYFVTRSGDALVLLLPDEPTARRAAEVTPVLAELFEARVLTIASSDLELDEALSVPAGGSPLERHVALLVAVQWETYLSGRIGAPDVNTFHAGYDTERLVAASMRTIRRSQIVVDE